MLRSRTMILAQSQCQIKHLSSITLMLYGGRLLSAAMLSDRMSRLL